MSLAARTRAVLQEAVGVYQDSPRATSWLQRQLTRFDDPLRLAVVGPSGSGRSTLVAALAGESPQAEMTWFRTAPGRSADELMLMDTPAIDGGAAPSTIEGISMDADAVLYLVRRPSGADLGFLHTLQDHPVARAAPVNALVVLSRADELGGGRIDAVISARQVARRYRVAPEVAGLCQDVVPVAGLLAAAGRTLTEPEFSVLRTLAAIPRAELEPRLLSADRFAAAEFPAPVAASDRAALLGRFGLFGVRLAVTLIRRGADTLPALAGQLVPRSGLADLREAIDGYFVTRRDVLKARSALIGLEVVLRMEPRPAAAGLAAELERLLAGAHEFRELRLVSALQTGRTSFSAELTADALRLLGAAGTSRTERLGGEQVLPAVRRWRDQVENPELSARERRAAAVVVRSCEAMANGTI
ncbi:GTPase domain-containing protein [Amycolatopsis viridis]|uniref:Energy-coupling factor transporter ATP-binding protein EcfA2 n=1 Tax=Amycolatopsis viridis TaxID=185678 RepID=A0ABX0T1E2_9PSEU|nr:GTPase domain-containing protein [Amycolatopsis viridis]NIH83048.1 energy-coupling factor transporter ATP-binding protein EcfA2 [Amycolatopsis viridis]